MTWSEETGKAPSFQAQLDKAVQILELPGAAMSAVSVGDRTIWSGASGHEDLAKETAWSPQARFRIGSVTKTFTTALLLQLVGESVVSLDDPLETWVPGFYDGLGVTLRHLVTNTSGIVSYNYVGSFDDTRPWTPQDLVEWAVANEPSLRFAPGSKWEYSNTNFVLVGLVIEAATGLSFEEALDQRILGPLGLTETYLAGSGDSHPDLVPCYDAAGTNITGKADPSFGWAAGAIVSTPADMARWAGALYGGGFLAPDLLSLMLTPSITTEDRGVDYGMGTFIEDDGSNAIYGHTGGIGGYLTYMYFARNQKTAVVVMTNVLETDLRELSAYGWSVVMDFEYPQ